jgi:hypothetical protein
MKEKKNPTKAVTVRFIDEPHVFEQVKELAKQNNRKLANQVLVLVKEGLRAQA